jgi:hypothetical protein
MRRFLFHSVAQVIGIQITIITWLADKSRLLLGRVGHFLMSKIDPTLLKTYESILIQSEPNDELAIQQIELNLLSSASKVRDHAAETGDWTDRHSEALNAIADALVLEVMWEEDAVHQYLREVVESIDGLEYEAEG